MNANSNEDMLRANSTNLPEVNMQMFLEYMANSDLYSRAEFRFGKLKNSAREDYYENAVGKVKLRREGDFCLVSMVVSPEHRLSEKPYDVYVKINEKDEEITLVECKGCVSGHGGCKHMVAAVCWLAKRSTEPPPTSVACYWRAPQLSEAKTTGRVLKISELKGCGKFVKKDPVMKPEIFQDWKEMALQQNIDCQILPYIKKEESFESISMDRLMEDYKNSIRSKTYSFNAFLRFSKQKITPEICSKIHKLTMEQAKSKIWHTMRFARVTASIFHQFSACKTTEGSLVEQVMGGIEFNPTKWMTRGLALEKDVLVILKKEFKDIKGSGLYLSSEYPFFGASPDAESDHYVFEVKSPMSEKTKKKYILDGEIQPKVKGQLHLQMLLSNKKKGFLILVDPKFESNKKIDKYPITFDKSYCDSLIKKCLSFYEKTIYNRLLNM